MQISDWMAALRQRNRLLYQSSLICAAIAALCVVGWVADPREVMGVNVWLKPMKFALSIGIYSLTMAWVLAYLPLRDHQRISRGTVVCMVVELGLILWQAARGQQSHFNISTIGNAAIFSTMGVFIGLNSLLVLYTLIAFFKGDIPLPAHMLWAWRIGLATLFLAGISGGVMSATLHHAVGVADGGPGLPLLNWSTTGGDWRVPHFFALHAFQVVPLLVWLLTDATGYVAPTRTTAFFAGLGYVAFCVWLHVMALQGVPLLGHAAKKEMPVRAATPGCAPTHQHVKTPG